MMAAAVRQGLELLLQSATARLAAVSAQPRDEAEWLLAELLGLERSRLRLHDEVLPSALAARYEQWLHRRAAGEPFAYISGTQPFRRLTLEVTPAVLIPRADTEQLVIWALEILAETGSAARVLDTCTGSGCVALAIADEAPTTQMFASDISPTALAVAAANGTRLGLAVQWLLADVLALPAGTLPFRLITANPPYIAEGDAHLPALHNEPALALVSGADGLDCLRKLILDAPGWLEPGGWLLLEHGYDQGEAVRALLHTRGYRAVTTRRDYGGNERVSGGQWHG